MRRQAKLSYIIIMNYIIYIKYFACKVCFRYISLKQKAYFKNKQVPKILFGPLYANTIVRTRAHHLTKKQTMLKITAWDYETQAQPTHPCLDCIR